MKLHYSKVEITCKTYFSKISNSEFMKLLFLLLIMNFQKILARKYSKELENYIIDSKFKCLLCHFIVSNLYQADCGCRYCENCIEEM